ncbi:SrfA family protein [Pseudomonas sp. Pseusp16]|uniref:SrfA family protein n=1 Tax=Pseudomonas sp. Pseusp16 TaxID=3243021 RepID=UPI0039B36F43
MRGALLRSGKSGSFTALGETGQPVYRAALQLREAIRRKNPDLVDHLAIPQSDELGNQIDWYSALDGDVIPWSSATEEERAPARRQLEALKTALEELSQRFLGTDSGEQQQGDKAVFGKLLKRVIHIPDENFVYLVQGKPVLTFWGFEHAGTDLNRDPLHCLYQVAPLPPVVEAPVVAPAVPVVARPWWRRWWWLLLLPLLLLLLWLLLGLRGCVPIPLVAVDLLPEGLVPVEKQLEEPPVTGNVTTLNGVPVTGTVVGSSTATGTGTAVTGTHDVEAPAVEGNEADAAPADLTKDPAKDPAAENKTTPPENKTAPPDVTSPEAEKSAATKPGPPLSIPPDAADGAARFLDGQYSAGAGIQDRRTGKPLRLEYQLKDGKGQVTVHQADGSKCSGPVSATMKGGSLAIDSQGQAVCGDGSTYDMPKVNCRKGATTVADCTGGYGKEQFPMSMRQVAE